jgi:sRNA-binding protein
VDGNARGEGDAVAGRADGFLKISLGLAFLVAAGSVGYHYAVYIPTRDAQLDSERRLEKAHAEFARKSSEERAQIEREAAEQRQAFEKAAAQAAYETCVARANENYNATWASNCKSLAESARKDRATCGAAELCDKIHPARDAGPNCSLPTVVASSINSELNRGKDRCLQESKAGLQ